MLLTVPREAGMGSEKHEVPECSKQKYLGCNYRKGGSCLSLRVHEIILCCSSLVLLAVSSVDAGSTSPAEEESERLQIIDTHIHLYDTNRSEGVDWPPVTDKVLYRPVLTEHFDEVADREGISSTVIVFIAVPKIINDARFAKNTIRIVISH